VHNSISDSTDEKYMVNCSRWIAARIFESVVVVAEVYEYPNLLLSMGILGSQWLSDCTQSTVIVTEIHHQYNTSTKNTVKLLAYAFFMISLELNLKQQKLITCTSTSSLKWWYNTTSHYNCTIIKHPLTINAVSDLCYFTSTSVDVLLSYIRSTYPHY